MKNNMLNNATIHGEILGLPKSNPSANNSFQVNHLACGKNRFLGFPG